MNGQSEPHFKGPDNNGMSNSRIGDGPTAPDRLPTQEREQPDPFLQMTTRSVGISGMALVAAAIVVILAIVFYGLNGSESGNAPTSPVAHNPAAAGNSGSASPEAPQSGPHNAP
jgi:hypothetical protein